MRFKIICLILVFFAACSASNTNDVKLNAEELQILNYLKENAVDANVLVLLKSYEQDLHSNDYLLRNNSFRKLKAMKEIISYSSD